MGVVVKERMPVKIICVAFLFFVGAEVITPPLAAEEAIHIAPKGSDAWSES